MNAKELGAQIAVAHTKRTMDMRDVGDGYGPTPVTVNKTHGLTKRELLAAIAMHSMLSAAGGPSLVVASQALEYADAMLIELAKETE